MLCNIDHLTESDSPSHSRRLALMHSAHCLRCSKPFKDQTCILIHMNQPVSSCQMQFEKHLKQARKRHTNNPSPPSCPVQNSAADDSFLTTNLSFPSLCQAQEDSLSDWSTSTDMDPNTSTEINHIEEYLGAAQTYGCGLTFLDKFDSDGHCHYRQDLPFYLFSSRDEWELACFLLCSDLSMATLDEFFKLALVCHVFLFYFSPLLCFFFLPD